LARLVYYTRPLLCADLGVVGLGDEAAVIRPEVLEGEDEGLEGVRHGDWRLEIGDW